ncbi:MAG: hypothetical protein HYW78_03625 [Parcubacteria group bacterium]|nr:hypothetical protein [Parcubacteria group bacterium]
MIVKKNGSERSELTTEYKGYRFSVDADNLIPCLEKFIANYEKGAVRDAILSAIANGSFDMQFMENDFSKGIFGTDFALGGFYRKEKRNESDAYAECHEFIVITLDPIIELDKNKAPKKYGICNGRPELWFAYVLAHEVRHWIQNCAPIYKTGRKFKMFLRRIPYYIIAIVGIIIFFLGIASLYATPFVSIAINHGFWRGFLYVLSFCGVVLWLSCSRRTYALRHFFDKKISLCASKLSFKECDADQFAQYVFRCEEWQRLVGVEKIK